MCATAAILFCTALRVLRFTDSAEVSVVRSSWRKKVALFANSQIAMSTKYGNRAWIRATGYAKSFFQGLEYIRRHSSFLFSPLPSLGVGSRQKEKKKALPLLLLLPHFFSPMQPLFPTHPS